jgi:hypothetical protein
MSTIAYANQEECFVKKETTAGTLIKPGTEDRVYSVGPVDFKQERELLEDEQIRASASRLPSIRARKMPGDWGLTSYVKPSGAKGTVPEHQVLFEALMGTETISGGNYVDYTLANQLPSFSLWMKKGHTVFASRGNTVNTATFSIAGESIAQITWGGQYMEQLWAGTCTCNDSMTLGKTTCQLNAPDAQLYTEGMYIEIGDDDNSGAGYQITDVNFETNIITFSPSLVTDQGSDPQITPWWPGSGTEVGEPVHGKSGIVTIDALNCIILTAEVTLTNNLKYYNYEKNNVWTAEQYGRPGKREIEGTMTLHLIEDGAMYFYRADYQVNDALIIPAGNVDGKIMELSIPYAEYRSPDVTGDEEFIEGLPFMAVASSSLNDEFKIRFK